MLKLATDFNGPLVDMNEGTRRALEEVTGLIVPAQMFTGKDIIEKKILFRPKEGGKPRPITLADWNAAKAEIYDGSDEKFFHYAVPKAGVVEALTDVWSLEYEVDVVSTCRGLTESRLRRWAQEYGIPINHVECGVENKGPYYGNAAVVVDDHLNHLAQFAAGLVMPILMAPKPPKVLPEKILCFPDWGQVVDHLLAMELR